MAVEVTITNPNQTSPPRVLRLGDRPMVFGRFADDVGRMRGRTVSREHGSIEVVGDGFAVTCTGTHLGVIVADLTTPSVISVPAGVGPIPMPFGDARLMVDQRTPDECLIIEVSGSAPCDQWRASWGNEVRKRWNDIDRIGTSPPWQHMKRQFRNGNVMSWYRTLVALCEPELNGRAGQVPTNARLAERLFLSLGVIEKDMSAIYTQMGFEPAQKSREEIVQLAILQGLVTRDDVRMVLRPFGPG